MIAHVLQTSDVHPDKLKPMDKETDIDWNVNHPPSGV